MCHRTPQLAAAKTQNGHIRCGKFKLTKQRWEYETMLRIGEGVRLRPTLESNLATGLIHRCHGVATAVCDESGPLTATSHEGFGNCRLDFATTSSSRRIADVGAYLVVEKWKNPTEDRRSPQLSRFPLLPLSLVLFSGISVWPRIQPFPFVDTRRR